MDKLTMDLPWGNTKGRAAMDFTVYAIHTDHLGTPIAMTDDSGTVVWTHRFSPFGESLELNADPDNDGESISLNLRFPGQYYDSESGLHYNWWRYYEPGTGVYLSPDSRIITAFYNFLDIPRFPSIFSSIYQYALSNPLSYIDESGEALINIEVDMEKLKINILVRIYRFLVGQEAREVESCQRRFDACKYQCTHTPNLDQYGFSDSSSGCYGRSRRATSQCQCECLRRTGADRICLTSMGCSRNPCDQ